MEMNLIIKYSSKMIIQGTSGKLDGKKLICGLGEKEFRLEFRKYNVGFN